MVEWFWTLDELVLKSEVGSGNSEQGIKQAFFGGFSAFRFPIYSVSRFARVRLKPGHQRAFPRTSKVQDGWLVILLAGRGLGAIVILLYGCIVELAFAFRKKKNGH